MNYVGSRRECYALSYGETAPPDQWGVGRGC